ncbi:MAG: mechanosensitive ion channel family protein [Dehalococcoidales bacterium]|nr:mechanosensitive ion channel family protein [Dehalococcoidales bacterium]
MQPQFVIDSPLLEAAWAVGLLLVSALVAWLVLLGIHRQERKLEKGSKATLSSQLLESLSRPVFLLIVSQGLLLSLSSVSYLAGWRPVLTKLSFVVLIVLITYSLTRTGSLLLGGYFHSRAIRRKVRLDEGLIRFLQRLLVIAVYALGFLILLDYLKISLTPFIAGLGIGGLAVALALQPALGNFFASTQIVSDRVVRVGDYIELEDGKIRGYVLDVGWRSTRIRTPFNNMVTIPNSVLANSIITNFYAPNMEMGVIVNCGVSYSSNLAQVEEIALAVAREVTQELDEAVKTAEPWFGYEEFGDSNINFWLWLQAKDRMASFRLKSELIKRLKTRFDREGITINYPVRTTYLHWPNGTPPRFAPGTTTPGIGNSEENH